MKSLDVFCICPVKSCSILTSAQQLQFPVTDDDMRLEALAQQTRHQNWLIYHTKKKKMQCTAPSPPSCLSFTLLDNVQPDFLWRLVNRNGSSAKLCTVGISTFLLSHKITACCSILCYGRCVPMGWLVEQRMGESRPACSSKQVLGAFEDAHLLQAKKGFGRRDVLAVRIRAHTDALALRFQHSQQSDNQDLWPVWSTGLLPGDVHRQKGSAWKGTDSVHPQGEGYEIAV